VAAFYADECFPLPVVDALRRRGHDVLTAARPERLMSANEVEQVVLEGDLVEDHPDDVRGHCCLLLGAPDGRPVHAVCSPRAQYLAIITACLPEPTQWSPVFRRRTD